MCVVCVVPFWWFILLGFPNGDAYFTALLNSGVHSIMYSYYALTSFGVRLPKPFKFFITALQQTQFLTMLYQCYYGYITDCSRPRIYMTALTIYLVTMLSLFANYQVHEYCSKGSRRAATSRLSVRPRRASNVVVSSWFCVSFVHRIQWIARLVFSVRSLVQHAHSVESIIRTHFCLLFLIFLLQPQYNSRAAQTSKLKHNNFHAQVLHKSNRPYTN